MTIRMHRPLTIAASLPRGGHRVRAIIGYGAIAIRGGIREPARRRR